mmetsp:Transcript_5898/g.8910  ORF Transcript_5898/g.8910 Transcript_5898/m.8910 type:complete len:208 (-) Transcript_5898:723-1346(-)
MSIRTPFSPGVDPSHVWHFFPKRQLEIPRRCKEAHTKQTPHSVEHMYRDGIHGIVQSNLHQKLGSTQVDDSGHNANQNGCPRFYDTACCGNRDQPAQAAIHSHLEIENGLSGESLQDEKVYKQGNQPCHTSRQGSVDGSEGHQPALVRRVRDQCAAAVKSVPTKPKDKCSKHLKRNRMARELLWLLELTSLFIMETPTPRSQDHGSK